MARRPWGLATEVERLVEQIRPVLFPLLAGHPPEIQGAVLADLTAIWLAGHVQRDDPELTAKLREALLDLHITAVRELLPINAKAIGVNG
jgi:hypothetical protein